jgi:WW domain
MSATSSGEITAMKDNNAESAIAAPDEASGSRGSTPSPSEVPKEQRDRSTDGSEAPPLPEEQPPPLPTEAQPDQVEDDGWAPVWDDNAQAFYFFNRFTNVSQWENPRVPEVAQPPPPGVGNYDRLGSVNETKPAVPAAGGYDPAIHGDYDPNADYAKVYESSDIDGPSLDSATNLDPIQAYAATGTFNRFTGKWQAADLNPEKFNDENKSRRQMNAFFDVDAAANSHDGKSLKAERSGKKLSKKEVKAFKEKRREKKEEKRRAWLRD